MKSFAVIEVSAKDHNKVSIEYLHDFSFECFSLYTNYDLIVKFVNKAKVGQKATIYCERSNQLIDGVYITIIRLENIKE